MQTDAIVSNLSFGNSYTDWKNLRILNEITPKKLMTNQYTTVIPFNNDVLVVLVYCDFAGWMEQKYTKIINNLRSYILQCLAFQQSGIDTLCHKMQAPHAY